MEEFTTQGGYFAPQGYMKVEAGGSHEENPNGGVQVGVDAQGTPNLLEEGEPIYKDFVYSDNITISDEMLEKHSLPNKIKGKLYSEAADWFVDEAQDRPLDAVSNRGLEAMLGRLADAQEEQKALKEQAELEEELAQMSPEELAELEAMMGGGEQQPMPEDMSLVPQTFKCGGRKYNLGGRLTLDEAIAYTRASGGLPPEGWEFQDGQLVEVDYPGSATFGITVDPNVTAKSTVTAMNNNGVGVVNEPVAKAVSTNGSGEEGYKALPTGLRYAGIAAAGLSGLHNLLQKPDEYHIPRLNPVLPSERMHLVDPTFTPTDVNLSANDVLASNAGTLRALQNAGLGGTTAAAMLAADYNTGQALGAARANAVAANNAQRNAVIAQRNQNASMLGEFDYGQSKDRATLLNDAAVRNAQNAYMEQAANYQAEAQKYAALQSNINAMAEGLAGIGLENARLNSANSIFANYYRDADGKIRHKKTGQIVEFDQG